jgi:DNA-binding transcriptional LysR family regulator
VIELRLLRYFIAVAETEHVGRAAARLHISQSPLSRQIQQLEELLGIRLFERERRRIRLTDAGRWLIGPAREVIARAESLAREARELGSGELGQISLGFVGAALVGGVLQSALRTLRGERPRVRIVLRQLSSTEQLAQLRDGALDLAMIHRRRLTSELEEHRLSEQPYVLVVPRPGRFARGAIRPAQLERQPWIAVSGTPDRDRVTAAWPAVGFTPDVASRSPTGPARSRSSMPASASRWSPRATPRRCRPTSRSAGCLGSA